MLPQGKSLVWDIPWQQDTMHETVTIGAMQGDVRVV